ncbi:MAG: right-handed parallel beta-helix repeat-containing protein [Thermoplasmata archaeon]|nr:right-handed parallel beta-helix repeat-containing protein [Thermoplasmata archaeon]
MKRESLALSRSEKGKLLFEENPEELEEKVKRRRRVLRVSGFALVGYLVFAMIVMYIVIGGASEFFWWFLVFFVGLSSVGIVFVFYESIRTLDPVRVYENGIDLPMGHKTFFLSFGEIKYMKEHSPPLGGKPYITFKTVGLIGMMFSLKKDMAGLEEHIEFIRSRIGRPEYLIYLEPTEEDRAFAKKQERDRYIVGLFMSVFIIGILSYAYYFGIMRLTHSSFVIVTGLPLLGMFLITFLTVPMGWMKRWVPPKLNVKVPITIVVCLLVYFFINMALADSAIRGVTELQENIGPKPTSTSLLPGTYSGMTLEIDDHILVDSEQTLHIQDSIVTMNLQSDKQFGIWIAKGGNLILENTTIQSISEKYNYTFEIMGSARIEGSTIANIWGDERISNQEGGLEVYSSDVIIERSVIRNATTNGILIVNSNPVIANTTIQDARDDGIEMQNSNARIMNNTIRNCGWAMVVLRGSNAMIEGNLIIENIHGIGIGSSNPTIVDNTFDNNMIYAIKYDAYSDPTITGNSFYDNVNNIEYETRPYTLEMCGIVAVAFAVACIFAIFIAYRNRLRIERKLRP